MVNISSIPAGTGGNAPGRANYSASKASHHLRPGAVQGGGRYKVNVNAVAFGMIKTRLTELRPQARASIDVRRPQDPRLGVNPDLLEMMGAPFRWVAAERPRRRLVPVYLLCIPDRTTSAARP